MKILNNLERALEREVPDFSWRLSAGRQSSPDEKELPENIDLIALQNGAEVPGGHFRVNARMLLRWGAAETARLISIGVCLRKLGRKRDGKPNTESEAA